MDKFLVGDFVVHRNEGVCKISKIENVDLGVGKTRYYVLKPYYTNIGSTIRVPVDNSSQLRSHISKRTAQILVKKLRKTKTAWINDNRKRKEMFLKMISSGDLESLGIVAHTIYVKKNEFAKAKKTMPLTDQNLMTFCERLLNEELAIALGIKIEDIPEYFEKHSK